MPLAILFAILTGGCWTLIGIILSRCASGKLNILAYSLLQTVFTGTAAILLAVPFSGFSGRDFGLLALFVFTGGAFNSIAQWLTQRAMACGNRSLVWAVSQSAIIFPFLVGVTVFHNRSTPGQWLGTFIVIVGVLLPELGAWRDFRKSVTLTLLAFLVFGLVQSLYSIPSQLGTLKAVSLRPALSAYGGFAGWLLIARHHATPLRFNRTTLVFAAVMTIVQLASLKLFFLSLDSLAEHGYCNIGLPLITGANIIGFALYSAIFLREPLKRLNIIGLAIVFCGLLLLAI